MERIKRATVSFKVSDLKPHPRQADNFDDLDDGPFKELVEDIRINGLNHPIEITPAGIVIDGHQRLRAVIELEWKVVAVIVRHDLAEQGEEAIELRMLDANLTRRQMDLLSIARVYDRQRQLLKKHKVRERNGEERQDLRDQLAKRFLTVSGRSLDRYARLLQLPRVLQREVSRGALPGIQAEQLLSAPTALIEKVVAAVVNGRNVTDVLKELLPPVKDKAEVSKGIDGAIRSLETSVAVLRQQAGKGAKFNGYHHDHIQKVQKQLAALLDRLK